MEAAERDVNQLDAVLADFTNRLRLGDAPSIDDYLARNPAFADDLRELLPVIAATENLKGRHRSKRSRGTEETPSFILNDDTAPSEGDQFRTPSREVLAFLDTVFAPPEAPGEIGRIGNYRVLELLGRGGMGAVFLAEDIQLHRQVALKVMLPDVAGQLGADERFLREARAAASLDHDNIVTIYQVDVDRGIPFIAMALLRGRSLEDRIAHGLPLSPLEIVRIGRQVADGLAAAHARGVIHRDIKPANIWLETKDERGTMKDENVAGEQTVVFHSSFRLPFSSFSSARVKLLDFGLARPVSADASVTQSGIVVGTPAYMSPEQARGEVMDGRADLFSLGVVLYRLSTGRLPFPGATAASVLMALGSETPSPPVAANPDIPAALSDLIVSMLAKNPAIRAPNAHCVSQRLRDIESSLARRIAPGNPRRKRWIALVVGLASLVAVAFFSVVLPRLGEVTPAEIPAARQKPQDELWRSLFNGKDLAGWKYPPQIPGDWKVEDGLLVGRGRPGWLFSDDQFGDFHLSVEMKLSPICDSGIFFWTPFDFKRFPDGKLNPSNWHEVNLVRTNAVANFGSLNGQNIDTILLDVPWQHDWFTVDVIATGKTVVSKIDGQTAATLTFPESLRGHLALQTPIGPDATVWIRRIDLKNPTK